jgi:hypothetical protein
VDWLRVDAGREGDGQGVATISVAPNGGPAREGTVIIAAQMFSVSQSAAAGPSPVPGPQPGCDFTAMADSNSFAAAGGEGTVRVVVAGPGCAWMATSNVPWISLVPAGRDRCGLSSRRMAARLGSAP